METSALGEFSESGGVIFFGGRIGQGLSWGSVSIFFGSREGLPVGGRVVVEHEIDCDSGTSIVDMVQPGKCEMNRVEVEIVSVPALWSSTPMMKKRDAFVS